MKSPDFLNRQITVTPDGLEAFFIRATYDASSNLGESAQIYTARRTSPNEPFGTPQPVAELAPPVDYGDNGPSISADELKLYFGRGRNGVFEPAEEVRWPTFGIYAATRPSPNASYAAPQEITTLKTDNDDSGSFTRPEVTADGLSL